MSTTKHTPGEWAHTDGSIYSYGVGHGADIATVNTDSAHLTDEEAEANARLIAAAPTMLQALKDCMSWFELNYIHYKIPMSRVGSPGFIETAQNAINKATGE